MKKFIFGTILAILLFLSFTIQAQTPSYEARLMNDYLISPSTYEFEIYVKITGTVPLEAYGLQIALLFNDTISNKGNLNAIYIANTSEMHHCSIPDINSFNSSRCQARFSISRQNCIRSGYRNNHIK